MSQVLNTEAGSVLESVQGDLLEVGKELGVSLISGLVEQILGGALSRIRR